MVQQPDRGKEARYAIPIQPSARTRLPSVKPPTDERILQEIRGGVQDDLSFTGLWAHVAEVILNGQRPRVTGGDGLRAIEVVEAAYGAAMTGERTQVTRLTMPQKVRNSN